jgi:uncharacterized protein
LGLLKIKETLISDPYGLNGLANQYVYGNDVHKDEKKGIEFFTIAAEQGNANSQIKLGVIYDRGKQKIVDKDVNKAIELYTLSANQGNKFAQFNLGTKYRNGTDVNVDLTKAFELFTLSSEQGYDHSQYYLGEMYENGRGVQKNLKKAIELYQLSADQGNKYGGTFEPIFKKWSQESQRKVGSMG